MTPLTPSVPSSSSSPSHGGCPLALPHQPSPLPLPGALSSSQPLRTALTPATTCCSDPQTPGPHGPSGHPSGHPLFGSSGVPLAPRSTHEPRRTMPWNSWAGCGRRRGRGQEGFGAAVVLPEPEASSPSGSSGGPTATPATRSRQPPMAGASAAQALCPCFCLGPWPGPRLMVRSQHWAW